MILWASLIDDTHYNMIENFISTLEAEFLRHANPGIAIEQKAYMREQFDYYGIKSPIRREIQKPFLMKEHLPPRKDLTPLVKKLWVKPQRDYQYIAQELTFKYITRLQPEDLALFEFMVLNKSWWDTIDYIAPKLIGNYFKMFPDQKGPTVEKWLASDTIWLQRSAILFQLKYKNELDTDFLSQVINKLLGSKEFFINKAIGWILREYGKTNPEWVIAFTHETNLSNLSRREALRLIH